MNLFETLKQFKNIQPDPAYSEISKRAILAMNPGTPTSARLLGRSLLRIIETGVAVALTGFFIFLITGGLSGTQLSPAPFAAIDPQSLKAEAQAIDIQIQLVNLTYNETSLPVTGSSVTANAGETTAPTSSSLSLAAPLTATTTTSTTTAETATTTTATPSSTLTVDQALEQLSN